jgi:hypothetical protein
MADLNFKTDIDDTLWDRCVEASAQGTIFLSSNFIRSLKLKYRTLFCMGKNPLPVASFWSPKQVNSCLRLTLLPRIRDSFL